MIPTHELHFTYTGHTRTTSYSPATFNLDNSRCPTCFASVLSMSEDHGNQTCGQHQQTSTLADYPRSCETLRCWSRYLKPSHRCHVREMPDSAFEVWQALFWKAECSCTRTRMTYVFVYWMRGKMVHRCTCCDRSHQHELTDCSWHDRSAVYAVSSKATDAVQEQHRRPKPRP